MHPYMSQANQVEAGRSPVQLHAMMRALPLLCLPTIPGPGQGVPHRRREFVVQPLIDLRAGMTTHLADMPHQHSSTRAAAWAASLCPVCLSSSATQGLSGPAVSAVPGARCEPLRAVQVQAGIRAGTAACQKTAVRPAQPVLWSVRSQLTWLMLAWEQGMPEAGLTCAKKVTLCMPVSSSSSLLAAVKGFSGGAMPPCSHSCTFMRGTCPMWPWNVPCLRDGAPAEGIAPQGMLAVSVRQHCKQPAARSHLWHLPGALCVV